MASAGGWMPTRAPETTLLEPSMVNSLLMVPLTVEAAQVVVVHRPLQRVGALERRAGDQAREAVGGAVAQRDLADQLAVDDLAHRGAAGFEDRPLGDDARSPP